MRREAEYVIEADANGSIVGGEWLVSSSVPPYSLWVPTGTIADNSRGAVYNPFVTVENIQTLLDLSREGA